MLTVNSERLNWRILELAAIGARADGGVCRLAFSEADLAGRRYIERALTNAGLEFRIDPIGNLYGILRGASDAPAIMIGSHTDTVATGGKYDGALGVLAALECIEEISRLESPPSRTIVLASFVNEEGVRFMPDMMGSLYHSGQLPLEKALDSKDAAGTSIGEELARLSYGGKSSLADLNVGYFLELHIEQGPVLERDGIDIGVVEGVQGLSWTEVSVRGASNHAGTTPMDLRQDAGLVAGNLMARLRDLPSEIQGLRLTIGSVNYHPNLINVIPDIVRFTVDMRHPDEDMLQAAEKQMFDLLGEPSICEVEFRSLARVLPCEFAPDVVDSIAHAADTLGYSSKRMISGAGHDAQILSGVYRAGMVFIPSKGGISHNVEEYSSPEQVTAGANVLFGAVQHLLQMV